MHELKKVMCLLVLNIIIGINLPHARGACRENGNCFPLDERLSMLGSGDTLSLSPGTYVLCNFSTDVVRDLSNVSIIGSLQNPQSVVITCQENVGLFFLNVTNLTITGVTIENCGIKGVDRVSHILNVTREVVDLLYTPLPDFSTAIFLAHCPNLQLTSVVIRENRGFGLVGINLVGDVSFHRLQVYQNYPSECVLDLERYREIGGSGGGVFLLYQDYLQPDTDRENYTDTHFEFTESNITDNYVCKLNLFNTLHSELPLSVEPAPSLNLSMIGAGGLTFALAQSDYRVNATFDTCTFQNNSGTYNGAAMHVTQFELSSDSHVVIERSSFLDNGKELIRQYGEKGVGPAGALHVWFYAPNPHRVMSVDLAVRLLNQLPSSVTVLDSTFERNVANSGGAMFVLSFHGQVGLIEDLLELNNSTFSYNRADAGGALYLSELSYSGFEHGLNVRLHNVQITRNDKRDTSASNSLQPESGIVDVSNINITLTGNNYISHNNNTAMSLRSATVTVSGNNLFEHNTGSTGGAVALNSESYLLLTGSTNLTFYQNSALIAGGAIYVNFGPSQFIHYDCFVFFTEIDFFCNLLENCKYQPVLATFTDNTAPLGSAIYGSTLSNCPWANGDFDNSNFVLSRDEIVSTLVSFEPSLTIRPELESGDPTIINTRPRSVLCPEDSNLSLLPGEEVEVQLGAFDQLNQSVPLTVFSQLTLIDGTQSSQATSLTGASNRYLIDGATDFTSVPLNVSGIENSTYIVSITSNEAPVQLDLQVSLRPCPLGFLYDNTSHTCLCNISTVFPEVTCESNGFVNSSMGPWIGFVPELNGFVARRCIFDYCFSFSQQIIDLNDPDSQCRNNRAGILCGGCKENFSRVLASSRCLKCNNNGIALILVFAILGILLVVGIALFNITITHGYINGVIFYANILSIYQTFSSNNTELNTRFSIITFVIRIVNLYNGIEACFYNGMTSLSLSISSLLFPLYLGAILLVITLILKYCHTRHFSKLTNKVNVVHTFATLLLLTYTSIVRTCIGLLSFVDIEVNGRSVRKWRVNPNQDYFAGLHIFGFFVALFFLIILAPFPLLLFPSLSLRLPFVRRMKPLIDAFTAPLADGRQFWVGFRLISRIFFFLLILMEETPRNITICVFVILITVLQAYLNPYKTVGRNLFDLQIMLNLLLVSFGAMISQLRLKEALTIGYILWVLYAVETIVLFVAYIIVALPCTSRLTSSLHTKLTIHWLKLKNAVKSWGGNGKKKATKVTHTSVFVRDNLPSPSTVDGDFRSAPFVNYRESILEL